MTSTSTSVSQGSLSQSTPKIELLRAQSEIDVEEEARLYDELLYSNDYEASLSENSSQLRVPHSTNFPSAQFRPTHRPRQRSRSLPPESIFSADIFLSDNRTTAADSPPLFAQDVRIDGWSVVGDGAPKLGTSANKGASIGGGAYVVYDCVITTREGTTMHLLKRYSAFEELRVLLKRTLPPSLVPCIPTLPPKSAFARFRPTFLDSRRKLLQFFLASILLHPDIGGREVVRRWVLA
ncbi:hypothetical protein CPB84DRAFT_287566 [Gymnopilus junonius]|uniref:Endosomal/vacuolar adapter protein YPT35 n=1 Tax=Gymnopilus junonius TaxID=109634 RepID=A0A9P5NDG1_GYMJU|nr:hypothetical protein CPB84DRAFT_287566 [Gymnopilus junonius]